MVYIKREIEHELIKWLESREIIAVRGARQSGKTTLLMRIKEILNNDNVDDDRIHYISFEDDIIRLKFEENVKEFIEFHLTSKKKHYFLLDEVQYIKDAGKKLKLIFDSFSNIKIFITGSSSFDLTNLGSYLVGRVIFFNLYPFSFEEFLKSKDEKYEKLHRKIKVDIKKEITIEKTVFLDELNKLLHEYLTYGSYPRIVLEKNQDKKKELLRNLFITYVEKDIVGMYGIKYREKVVKLLKAIAYTSGNVINYETLSTNSDLKYHNVREILPLLEDSFVISIVRPFHKNLMNELRKNPKIYFLDYGIRNYLLETFDNIRFDYLYETFVHNELKRSYQVKYWRTTAKTEVDFVVLYGDKIVPLEVKIKPKITRSFRSFIQHYNPDKALILNLNILDKKNIDNCNIFMLPFVYI